LRLSIVSRLSVAVAAVLILALSANLLLDHGMRIMRVRDGAATLRTAGAPRSYPINHVAHDAPGAALAQLEANIDRQRLSSDALLAALDEFERTTQLRALSDDDAVVAEWHSSSDALS